MSRRISLPILAFTLVLGACAHGAQTAEASPAASSAPKAGMRAGVVHAPTASGTAPSSAPTATPAPGSTGASIVVAPSEPSAAPSSEPSNAPATPATEPTATPVVIAAPNDPPRILFFAISAQVVHPGDILSGSVTASSNVASVEVRVAGYSYPMVKTGPGRFVLSATVPNVPVIFRRTYPLVAIARNTRGDATERETQITIR